MQDTAKGMEELIAGATAETTQAAAPRTVDKAQIVRLSADYLEQFAVAGCDNANGNLETVAQYCAYYRLGLPRRGLFFMGNVGTGKTLAAKIMANMFYDRMRFVRAQDIVDEHKAAGGGKKGRAVMQKYGKLQCEDWTPGYWDRHSYTPLDLFIDDIGAEQTRNDFGEIYEVIAQLIDARENQYKDTGAKTFFTSNLKFDELADRYDDRTAGRIRGLCTTVIFRGGDRRRDGGPIDQIT